MFERFTERARQVVVLAQDEARALKHDHLGTEHILLGLAGEGEGVAAQVLRSLDVTVEEVRAQVVRIAGPSDKATTGQIPFTPRAMKVLELALREAQSLGHEHIGTEHILLGLVRENEGVAARILLDFDVDAQKVRTEVIRMLGTTGPSRPADLAQTPRVRAVLLLAQDEARTLRHDHVGTEHILLGLLREERGLAARVLDTLDITIEEVRAQVKRLVPPGDEAPAGELPLARTATNALELAGLEALSLAIAGSAPSTFCSASGVRARASRDASWSTSTPVPRGSATRSFGRCPVPAGQRRRFTLRPRLAVTSGQISRASPRPPIAWSSSPSTRLAHSSTITSAPSTSCSGSCVRRRAWPPTP